jgi:F-type H+-transporting ATPase subunit b
MWHAKRVWNCLLIVALLSIPMTAAGSQNHGPLSSNPKTSGVGSQPQGDVNNTQSSENCCLNEPAGVGQATDGGQMNEPLRNSPSLKWIADESGISTIAAYRLSVAFNFAALVILIVIPLKSRLPSIFHNRTELIRQSLENAERTSTEAKKRLLAIESRFARIGFEIMAIQLRADLEWKAEEDRIRTAIAGDNRRIAEMVDRDIAVLVDRARHELKAYAADLAVTLAAARIQVDIFTDQSLVRNFIDQLGRNGNNRASAITSRSAIASHPVRSLIG